MLKKFFLFYSLVYLINVSTAHADKGLYLIQVTQPEKQRIDIKFYPFFFLEAEEESALKQLSNKHTLYTYEKMEKKDITLQKEIGPVTVSIKVQRLGQGGKGGSSPGIEVSVSHKDRKILDQVVFKEENFTEISVIHKDDTIILSLSPSPHWTKVENYEIKTNLNDSLKSYRDIKTYAHPL